jgi:uroporphyrinogen-III decarboxylase
MHHLRHKKQEKNPLPPSLGVRGDTKKEIGDTVCLCGGMPSDLLARGTKKECIDYAKRLIDELASDGGFIFSQDKMISYPNDCSAENLKAVNEFVQEYRI